MAERDSARFRSSLRRRTRYLAPDCVSYNMIFLHFSDIHFKAKDGGPLDVNRWLRQAMLRDVRATLQGLDIAHADGILISGDIAQSAQKDEYDVAYDWLRSVCEVAGCTLDDVFTCPGNHDVVRKLADGKVAQAIHNSIRGADGLIWEHTLIGFLEDDTSRQILYAPLANYNEFAKSFSCDLFPPDRTYAKRDLQFPDGTTLRLVGANSAIISSSEDDRLEGKFLFIDPPPLNVQPEDGVVYLVMSHHPPAWIKWDHYMSSRWDSVAKVQLFGHEHKVRVDPGKYTTRVFAGALHPSRAEPEWRPGYNLIQLDTAGTGESRTLNVKVHVRALRASNPYTFESVRSPEGNEFWDNEHKLEKWTAPSSIAPNLTNAPVPAEMQDAAAIAAITPATVKETGAPMTDSTRSIRQLSRRFHELDLNQKSIIAGTLRLMDDADSHLPDFEKFRRVLNRAKEQNKIEDLEAAIIDAENGTS